jgi:hypothetical protein
MNGTLACARVRWAKISEDGVAGVLTSPYGLLGDQIRGRGALRWWKPAACPGRFCNGSIAPPPTSAPLSHMNNRTTPTGRGRAHHPPHGCGRRRRPALRLSHHLCEVKAMSEAYENNLANLRREIETGGARPTVIDMAIAELLADCDERLPSDMLSLLSDSAEYDEGMFSLIHAAESYDDSAYVRAVLSAFPNLISSAPRWASIILMRIPNSRSAQLEIVRQLRDTPTSIKESVREMCRRINEVSPQFLSKTIPVTLAAS